MSGLAQSHLLPYYRVVIAQELSTLREKHVNLT
uniref:Uncharacterized protein n=1 Tax=Anguilla anguilla TaxID=7936 RepID=A0A0E9RP01_ANGAN